MEFKLLNEDTNIEKYLFQNPVSFQNTILQKKFYMGIKFKIMVSTCFLLTNCFNSNLNFDSDFMINIPNCNLIDYGQNILPNTHQRKSM